MRKPKFVESEDREDIDLTSMVKMDFRTLKVYLWGGENSRSFIPIRVFYLPREGYVVSLSVTSWLDAAQAKMHAQAYAYAVSLAEKLNKKIGFSPCTSPAV